MAEGNDKELGDKSFLSEVQNPKIRRKIRHDYRELIQETQKNRDDMLKPDSNKLQETLLKSSECFKNVKQTREAAMDSSLMAMLATIGRQKAQAIHTDLVRYHPAEFTEKLITYLNERRLPENNSNQHNISDEGWDKLGKAVQPFFKCSPPLHLLYGSLERDEPVRKIRSKNADTKKDKAKGPATAPKQLKNFSGEKEQETTTAEVENVLAILRDTYRRNRNKPMCFFEFVINPTSFSQTVENIFYCSFLVKDNHARIFLGEEDKLPVIEPVISSGQNSDDQQRHQVIVTLSKEEWKDIVSTFDIARPAIPTRHRTHSISNGDGIS